MENYFNCIYMYINTINNKKYIGKAKDFNRRHKEHLNSSFNTNCKDYKLPIHNAIRKYGFECFEVKIIATDINSERIDELEKFFIDKYNTTSCSGYNVASGGQGGNTFLGKSNSEMTEIRKKISMSNKNKPKSTEHNKKNSESHIGLQVREKNGRAKKVKAVDEVGNIKIFNCALDASDFISVERRTLQYYLRGKSKTNFYKGYYWEYIN